MLLYIQKKLLINWFKIATCSILGYMVYLYIHKVKEEMNMLDVKKYIWGLEACGKR